MSPKNFKVGFLTSLVVAVVAVALVRACSGDSGSEASVGEPVNLSPVAWEGGEIYNRTCVLCHGTGALGSETGPPLVHRLYEPGHHPDVSFRNAVKDGVIAHHWEFGHMPAQQNVSDEDVEKIICYVRELQIAGGIFEGEGC